jgi:hypothetical protein
MLKNPSFEKGDKKPESWERWSGKDSEAQWSTDNFRSGKRSVSILTASGKSGCRWILEEGIKVVPGAEYLLTGWIKTKDAKGNCSINIAWYSTNGWIKTSKSLLINKTHDWRLLKVKAKAPEKAVCAKIYVGKILAGSGQCWFDDLSFEQTGSLKPENKVPADTENINWSKYIEKPVSISLNAAPEGTEVNRLFKLNPNGALSLKVLSKEYSIKDTFDYRTGWISQEQKVKPGDNYGFQAAVFRNKSYNVFAGITWFNSENKIIMVSKGKVDTPLNKWQKVSISIKAPANASKARFFVIQSRSSGETKIKDIKQ